MKKRLACRQSVLLPFFLNIALAATGQTLPAAFHLSEDGRRLLSGGQQVEGFYAADDIHTLALWFDQPDYWSLLQANYAAGTDIPALLVIDGDTLDSPVGVHFKGQTSYLMLPPNTQKMSFAIDLDFADPGQSYEGYESYNLHNCYDDPSFLREVIYCQQSSHHIPAAKANYAHLYINGQDWGLYPNVQQLDGAFLEEWFLSDNGTRWRALKTIGGGPGPGGGGPGSGGPFGTGFSSLNWLGTADTSEYKKYYTLKKAHKAQPWEDLVVVCSLLNNTPTANLEAVLRPYLDIDRTLWFLATEIAFSDDDSYVHKGGMDYYLYWEPETGRLTPQEVDGNTCMKPQAAGWSPFYHETDIRYPLLHKLLAVPSLRQRYLAHFRTIRNTTLSAGSLDSLVDLYAAQIDDLVFQDPKKLYPYSQFLSEQQLLKNFVQQRQAYLSGLPYLSAAGPSIDSVSYLSDGVPFQAPSAGQPVQVRARVTSGNGISDVFLYYGGGLLGHFQKTTMYDDGQHGDGMAGDGLFGATVPGFGNGQYVRFYVEALAADPVRTASYFPEGAEHDVFFYRVAFSGLAESPVAINELMASNTSTMADQDGEYDDWIELHNLTEQPVDLSGWHLSDNPDHLGKWSFPEGTFLDADAYLIVWADEDGSQDGLHASFKLSAGGEDLILTDPGFTIGQHVVFPAQAPDLGYARVPNGTGDFVPQAPTFRAHNTEPTGIAVVSDEARWSVRPNPARSRLHLSTTLPEPQPVRITNAVGQVVRSEVIRGSADWSVDGWIPGWYFLQAPGFTAKILVH